MLTEKPALWYVDASHIDNESEFTRRFGFGMVAVDEFGRLVAAAMGTPPSYVQTIAQAEAHAVATVMRSTTARASIATDCLSNLTLLKGGFAAATNGKKRAARTWNINANAADWDPNAVPLRWIPAHRSWASVSSQTPIPLWSLGCSGSHGGVAFSRIDWQCNRAVDLLAKISAQRHRTDWATRNKLRKAKEYTRSVRSRLGQITWASPSTTKWRVQDDGSSRAVTVRDSVGKPARNAPRGIAKKRPKSTKKPKQDTAAPPIGTPAACPADANCLASEHPPAQHSVPPWADISCASDKLLAACRRTESQKKRKVNEAAALLAPPAAAAPSSTDPEASRRIRRIADELCTTASSASDVVDSYIARKTRMLDVAESALNAIVSTNGQCSTDEQADLDLILAAIDTCGGTAAQSPRQPTHQSCSSRQAFLAQLRAASTTKHANTRTSLLEAVHANARHTRRLPQSALKRLSTPAGTSTRSSSISTAMRNLMAAGSAKPPSADERHVLRSDERPPKRARTKPPTPHADLSEGAAHLAVLPGRQAAPDCAVPEACLCKYGVLRWSLTRNDPVGHSTGLNWH
jgi:hypothetical protein